MSRSGYVDSDGCDEYDELRAAGWRANVRRAVAGRNGQKFLWELYQALEAVPERRLTQGALQNTETGEVCSLGALAVHRKMVIPPEFCTTGAADEEMDEYEFADAMGPLFGVKDMLAREIMYENDEGDVWHWEDDGTRCDGVRFGDTRKVRRYDTPEERWQRMRRWVVSHLKNIP